MCCVRTEQAYGETQVMFDWGNKKRPVSYRTLVSCLKYERRISMLTWQDAFDAFGHFQHFAHATFAELLHHFL